MQTHSCTLNPPRPSAPSACALALWLAPRRSGRTLTVETIHPKQQVRLDLSAAPITRSEVRPGAAAKPGWPDLCHHQAPPIHTLSPVCMTLRPAAPHLAPHLVSVVAVDSGSQHASAFGSGCAAVVAGGAAVVVGRTLDHLLPAGVFGARRPPVPWRGGSRVGVPPGPRAVR